jgi:predicted transport protein
MKKDNGEKISENTRKMYYSTILSYFREELENEHEIKQLYYEEFKKSVNKVDKQIENRKKQPLKINYQDLINFIDTKIPKDTLDYIVLYLHSRFPLRSDFMTLKIKNYKSKIDNYWHINKKLIVFNHRTKNTESIQLNIPVEFMKQVLSVLKGIKKNRIFLIVNALNEPFTKSCDYSKYIKRVCRRNGLPELSPTDFRKIEATSRKELIEQMNEALKIQGHSLETEQKYYHHT